MIRQFHPFLRFDILSCDASAFISAEDTKKDRGWGGNKGGSRRISNVIGGNVKNCKEGYDIWGMEARKR